MRPTPTYYQGVTDDATWEAVVAVLLGSGHAYERRSRYGDKPALFVDGREIAHLEAPGVIDLRVTHLGWSQAKETYRDDPLVRRDPGRRDWIELHPTSAADVDHLAGLLTIAVAGNRR